MLNKLYITAAFTLLSGFGFSQRMGERKVLKQVKSLTPPANLKQADSTSTNALPVNYEVKQNSKTDKKTEETNVIGLSDMRGPAVRPKVVVSTGKKAEE